MVKSQDPIALAFPKRGLPFMCTYLMTKTLYNVVQISLYRKTKIVKIWSKFI